MAGIWAVHISAGVLQWPWLLGGYAVAGVLIVLASAAVKLRSRQNRSGRVVLNLEDEIPRIALLTAVFFVGSLMHIRIGPTSVHLLLTGLVGLTLGPWACIAVPVGLCLQAVLLGHGDLSTLGVNTCVLLAPALMARTIYRVGLHSPTLGLGEAATAISYMLFPWSALVVGPAVIGLKRWDRGLHVSDEYRAGFLVGFTTVLLSVLFNGLVLVNGGNQNWLAIALVVGAAHVPVAMVEGIITGFTVSFLIRVKPELLDGSGVAEESENHAIGVSSSSGTSH